MGELASWGKKNNKFITIADGETIEVQFQGARVTQSSFDPEQETIQYKLDDKLFNCASRKLAVMMDDVPVGSRVRITRVGQKNKTRYSVDVIG